MAYFTQDFIEFFKELAGNNNKEWFDLNRKRYERVVKEPFQVFIGDMIELVKKDDPSINISPKDAIFRINRDIRFSKDKTPYKLQVSAIVASGGRKEMTKPGMYLELTPEHVRVYSGVYMPDKDVLYNIRSYMLTHLKEFDKLKNEKEFKEKYGNIRGEANKVIPKEFKDAALKEPLIFNKQFYYFGEMKPDVLLRDDLSKLIMEYYFISKPVNQFFTKAILG